MNSAKPIRSAPKQQRGYALVMVMFFTVLLMLSAMAVSLPVKTEGAREKETEMVWRGKQYVRGIKLYYRKTGRFPTSLEDLTKPKTGLRFMRKAYTDPMNSDDGSWRLIYVGPAGQLIGSLKPNPGNLRLPGIGGPANPGGTPLGRTPTGGNPLSPQNPPGAQPSGGDASSGPTSGAGGQVGGGQTSGGQTGGFGQQPTGTGQTDTSGTSSDASNLQPTTIIGGNIIGVGSKINKKSYRIYEKGQRYREWEFIWDPSKDVVLVSQPGTQIGTPIGNPTVTGPSGAPGNPQPNPNPPPNTPPNPQQP
jgi:hypothetical protein